MTIIMLRFVLTFFSLLVALYQIKRSNHQVQNNIQTAILCPVDCASLHNLVNEINLVHDLFLVYFANFIHNLYMFWTAGTTAFRRHLVFVCRMDPAYQTVGYTE